MSLPTFHAAEHGETVTTEHFISLPLERPNKQPRLDVYFCIVEKVGKERAFFESLSNLSPRERAKAYVEHAAMEDADSMILYLQGGPGYGAPTPVVGLGLGGSWAGEALKTYKRVVLMDQRGTGRSTPVTKQYLERTFPDLFLMDGGKEVSTDDVGGRLSTAVQQVSDYLTNFRADNIVYDAEEIRDALLVPNLEEETGKPKAWGASLGQSFGGFCSMSYLSLVEHPPKVMLLTGGIAPMLTPVYDVYCMLWDRVRERNYRYYDMYPGDVPVVKSIVRKLLQEPATLPSGGKLTSRRFLQLGLGLGSSPSAFASMHALLSSAFLQSDDLEFSRGFLKQIDEVQSFDDAPFYFWLHESIYADGAFNSPTNWAAHRAYIDKCKACSDFDYTLTCSSSDDRPVLFFGEHVFPWMAEDFAELSGVGLTQVANSLASRTDWPKLYDAERMRAALDGKTSAAAAVYHEDMYVEFEASMKVAARGGPLEKCKVWVTNEYQHSGLRDDGAKIFSKLLGMATGSIRTPS